MLTIIMPLIVIRPRETERATGWHERLSAAGFDIAVREGNLRISPHVHNSHEEVAGLIEKLTS